MLIEHDFAVIYSEYEKAYKSFWFDYQNISYERFYDKLTNTGGALSDLIRARKILLGEINEKNKEMKKWARNFSRPDIEEYRQSQMKNQDLNVLSGIFKNLGEQMNKNKEKNEKHKKNKIGGNIWRTQPKK